MRRAKRGRPESVETCPTDWVLTLRAWRIRTDSSEAGARTVVGAIVLPKSEMRATRFPIAGSIGADWRAR
jgi:hypothetical protein